MRGGLAPPVRWRSTELQRGTAPPVRWRSTDQREVRVDGLNKIPNKQQCQTMQKNAPGVSAGA